MVAMVRSGGGLSGKRSDHSDHGLTIGVTIALLLPNKRVTIVTIALFWVLARRARGHGQNGPFGQNGPKLDKTSYPFLLSDGFLFFVVKGCWTGTGTTDAE